jgi:Integrase zinc binding domain
MVLTHGYHDTSVSGHLGIDKTLTNLQWTFTWPGIRRQLTAYIGIFDQCQRRKASIRAPTGLLQPLEISRNRANTSHSTSS